MRTTAPYRRRADTGRRIVVMLPDGDLEAIDRWGVPAGMPSRTAAIRELIKKGLEAVAHERTGP